MGKDGDEGKAIARRGLKRRGGRDDAAVMMREFDREDENRWGD
jgi:hypothetical protein